MVYLCNHLGQFVVKHLTLLYEEISKFSKSSIY